MKVILGINDMRLAARIASAAAATVITGMMLVGVGLGFANRAQAGAIQPAGAAALVTERFQ